ncbi:AMP-binding protein [Pseudonocardia kunmingensis]|nr:AMP-binding protein [Pseudonocardia kunmingensis]
MRGWTVPAVLEARARDSGDEVFLRMVGGGRTTYAQTFQRARTIGGALIELGVEPAENVVVLAPNSIDTVHAWLGINLAGAVEVPLHPGARGTALQHLLADCDARVVLIDEEFLPRLLEVSGRLPALRTVVVMGNGGAPLPRPAGLRVVEFARLVAGQPPATLPTVAASHAASIIYTSGTSGPPKGVIMPHGQAHVLARTAVEGLRMTGRDVYYCYHPLHHMAGKFMAIFASILAGGSVALDVRFSADTWLERIRDFGATVTVAHGPMLEMVHRLPARADDADNPLTRVQASPFPARIAEAFEARFAVRGIEVYGMTEINVPCWRPYDEPLRVGSCGRIRQDLFEMAVVDPDTDEQLPPGQVGEFVVRPRLPWTGMQGYLNQPAATVRAWRNSWFHTGDRGRIDADGYVYFVDRASERIRRRAENVSAEEIEAAALTHRGVVDCAAVGVPSEFEADDDIKLTVVCGEPAVAPEVLLAHLASRLAHHMVPRYVEFRDALPRTPTQKVQKAALRADGVARAWDRYAAGISVRTLVEDARSGIDGMAGEPAT